VQPDELFRAPGEHGHLGDRQRRGVAGEESVLLHDLVEGGEGLPLLVQVLDDGLALPSEPWIFWIPLSTTSWLTSRTTVS
jgi:hypothetical protein